MYDTTHRSSLPGFTALLILFLFLAAPAAAQGPLSDQALLRGHLIPAAVGMRMAGDAPGDSPLIVSFAARPRISGFLKTNDAHLEKVALIRYGEDRLTGNLYYGNALGRAAYYGFDIRYAAKGNGRYHVKGRTITPFEPLTPRAEIYFVPAGPLSPSMLKTLPPDELLRWARQNREPVAPFGRAMPVRRYDVLCFCMDRLMDGARWELSLNGQLGTTRSKGGWHVAHMAVDMALNAPQPQTFIVFHTRGRKSVNAGARSRVAAFTNAHLPPPAPLPVPHIPVPQGMVRTKNGYKAKNLPNLAPWRP
ncbi:MAG: hypothetical protein H0S80_09115 [Desulfovibrionaceae bacterium]|nr:hypothetical protein [Desulfovibrionaceae bacterium]